jgi:hypothetical protein
MAGRRRICFSEPFRHGFRRINLFRLSFKDLHAQRTLRRAGGARSFWIGSVFAGVPQDKGWVHSFCTIHWANSLCIRLSLADDCDRPNVKCPLKPSSNRSRGAWMPSTRSAKRSRLERCSSVAFWRRLEGLLLGSFGNPFWKSARGNIQPEFKPGTISGPF